jgi:uncharacterized membrane protein
MALDFKEGFRRIGLVAGIIGGLLGTFGSFAGCDSYQRGRDRQKAFDMALKDQ